MKVNPLHGGEGCRGGVILKVNDAVYFLKLISWSLKQHPEFFLFKMAVSESFFYSSMACNRRGTAQEMALCDVIRGGYSFQVNGNPAFLGSTVWSSSKHVEGPSETIRLRPRLHEEIFIRFGLVFR